MAARFRRRLWGVWDRQPQVLPQSSHLLPTQKGHLVRSDDWFSTSEIPPQEPGETYGAAQHHRRIRYAAGAFEELEHWMVAERSVLQTPAKESAPPSPGSRSGPIMKDLMIRTGAHPPAEELGLKLSQRVRPAVEQWRVAANLFKTTSPEHLNAPGNRIHRITPPACPGPVRFVHKCNPRQSPVERRAGTPR